MVNAERRMEVGHDRLR